MTKREIIRRLEKLSNQSDSLWVEADAGDQDLKSLAEDLDEGIRSLLSELESDEAFGDDDDDLDDYDLDQILYTGTFEVSTQIACRNCGTIHPNSDHPLPR